MALLTAVLRSGPLAEADLKPDKHLTLAAFFARSAPLRGAHTAQPTNEDARFPRLRGLREEEVDTTQIPLPR